jgi:hypothetical protein
VGSAHRIAICTETLVGAAHPTFPWDTLSPALIRFRSAATCKSVTAVNRKR